MIDQVAVATAQPAALALEDAEHEARRAAAFVGVFVGVPAVIAAGAVIFLFALVWLVLLAPVIAAVLTLVAWRFGGPGPGGARASPGDPEGDVLRPEAR